MEPRQAFRGQHDGEDEAAYNLAKLDNKVELSLRRSHQLHSALSAVVAHEQMLRQGLFGDPRIPGSIGAVGSLTAQMTAMQETQKALPGQMATLVQEARDEHDLKVYRGLRRWLAYAVGSVIICVVIALVLVLTHLPSPTTPP